MLCLGTFVYCQRPLSRHIASPLKSRRGHIEAQAGRSPQGCRLIGVGSSAPETVLTNFDLEKIVNTSDDWITRRTGIRKRRVLGIGEKLSDHAVKSALKAMDMAEVKPLDIDCVLFATSSPDDIFGSACQVQHQIGAKRAAAFDLTSACSGFVIALITAAQYIRSGTYNNILIVGGDALSRFIDWRDRGTCILFGDGCGAVVMTNNGDEETKCALMGLSISSDGGGYAHLNAPYSNHDDIKALSADGTASSLSRYCNIKMNGPEVYKWAVQRIPKVIDAALNNGGITKDSIDWLILHQANQRIIDATAVRLKIPEEKVVSNLAEYGNTSAASIPLALDEAVRKGDIQSGHILALAGFGAGLTVAAAIVRWD